VFNGRIPGRLGWRENRFGGPVMRDGRTARDNGDVLRGGCVDVGSGCSGGLRGVGVRGARRRRHGADD